MKIQELQQMYSLVESEVLEIQWEREFRDLALTLEGIWRIGEDRPDYHAKVRLTLKRCVWVEFDQRRQYAESTRPLVRHSITIIDFDRCTPEEVQPRLRAMLSNGYESVSIVSDETVNGPWITAVFRDLDLSIQTVDR